MIEEGVLDVDMHEMISSIHHLGATRRTRYTTIKRIVAPRNDTSKLGTLKML